MKKVLAVAFVLAILSLGFSASAQVPYVQVFFDIGASVDAADCPAIPTVAELSVFAINFNMFIAAIDYQVVLPGLLTFLGDVPVAGALRIGTSVSPTGIAWSYPIPGNGWAPYKTQGISVFWNCIDCTGWEDSQILVLPYPSTGLLTAVSWPDLQPKYGIGMISTVCPFGVPTQNTTWGNVKSLYNK